MSKFSVYLKELFDQRGEPIARVAKTLGIERTSITRRSRMKEFCPIRQSGSWHSIFS